MRAKLGIGAALVVAAISLTMAIGAANASGRGKVHVVFPAKTTLAAFIDENNDGHLTLGDSLEAKGPLRSTLGGDRVGKAFQHCVVVARIAGRNGGMYRCSILLSLANGKIILEGLDPHGVGRSTFAVLGGTGNYRGASGQALFTDTRKATDMSIELRR